MSPEYEIFYLNIQMTYKKYETIVKTKLLLGKMNKKLSSTNMPPGWQEEFTATAMYL